MNIDIVNLANNHIYDFGVDGIEQTKDILEANHVQYFGVDNRQLNISKGEVKIALHGYCCYSTNPLGFDQGLNVLDIDEVEKNLLLNSKQGKFNIVSCHFGEEHVHAPNFDHVLMSRQFSEITPYILYGHHPHVIQGIELLNDSLIAYSLGNFCFDDIYTNKSTEPLVQLSESNKQSFILEIEINDSGIYSHKVIPIYIGEHEMIIGESEILEKIQTYSNKLKNKKEDYIVERRMKLDSYLNSRRNMRDFHWYVKRLKFSSVQLLYSAFKNKKGYQKFITKKLR